VTPVLDNAKPSATRNKAARKIQEKIRIG